jgi:hypothetical protein
LKAGEHGAIDPHKVVQQSRHRGTTMLERALPIPKIALGRDPGTPERTNAREFARSFWGRIKQLLRGLADFFASAGPLS